MLGVKVAGCNGCVRVIVILGGVIETFLLLQSLVAITTGNGIADEFDLSGGEGWRLHQLFALVEHKAPKLWEELIALDGIHQSDRMHTIRKCCGKSHHRVALPTKSHLERFCLIDLSHKITTTGFGYHTQRGALERGNYLNTREVPGGSFRIGKADTPCVLDELVRRTDDTTLDGYGLNGKGTRTHQGEQCR